MDISLLEDALVEFKNELERAIRTARFNNKEYNSGQRAKEALIRSQRLILKIHEVAKDSLSAKLDEMEREYSIHPQLGRSSPELKISGFIKAKQQDIVILFDGDRPIRERITEGPLEGAWDVVGKSISEKSIVIGVRSQMSSVAKNFDTLMERAFAETLNLRLRLPGLTMGEVYLLPVKEYDDVAMRQNTIAWKKRPVPVEKFIRTFLGISGREADETNEDLYKYERSALILVDFEQDTPKVFLNLDQLKKEGFVPGNFEADFDLLSPENFAEDLLDVYNERHPEQ